MFFDSSSCSIYLMGIKVARKKELVKVFVEHDSNNEGFCAGKIIL